MKFNEVEEINLLITLSYAVGHVSRKKKLTSSLQQVYKVCAVSLYEAIEYLMN
jgi:hypothetical protein